MPCCTGHRRCSIRASNRGYRDARDYRSSDRQLRKPAVKFIELSRIYPKPINPGSFDKVGVTDAPLSARGAAIPHPCYPDGTAPSQSARGINLSAPDLGTCKDGSSVGSGGYSEDAPLCSDGQGPEHTGTELTALGDSS
jgi:hypothetical protein